ncbi:hypothetical protein ACFW04_011746 [Cataglyphis niger]
MDAIVLEIIRQKHYAIAIPENPASFSNYTRIKENVLNDLSLFTSHIQTTGNTFQDLAYSTRIAPNILSQIMHETLQAIIKVLEEKVMVALDGKHIVFRPSRKEESIYCNYKGDNNIVLFAFVDTEYKFIFVDIGRNGRMHDLAVLRNSSLGIKLNSNSLNISIPNSRPGFLHKKPYVIVSDNAFPFKKRIFNYRLSRTRRVMANAFGILANRFCVILNPILVSGKNCKYNICMRSFSQFSLIKMSIVYFI